MQCRFNDSLAYQGECRKDRNCNYTSLYDPVCGVNGKTYSNKGELDCAKMAFNYKGQCR